MACGYARPMPEPDGPIPAPTADWASSLAQSLERAVDSVRSRTTEPVARIVRWLAVGGALTFIGFALVILVFILFGRLLAIMPGPVWSAYLVSGGIFVVAGVLVLRLRTPRVSPAENASRT